MSCLISTSLGDIYFEFFTEPALQPHIRSFTRLIANGFFDGSLFHKIERNFIAIAGDVTGDGGEGGDFFAKRLEKLRDGETAGARGRSRSRGRRSRSRGRRENDAADNHAIERSLVAPSIAEQHARLRNNQTPYRFLPDAIVPLDDAALALFCAGLPRTATAEEKAEAKVSRMDEFSHKKKGMLCFANSVPNQTGSAFYISLTDGLDRSLDGEHTQIGKIRWPEDDEDDCEEFEESIDACQLQSGSEFL